MSQQSGETALISAIKAELDKQFNGQPPPQNQDDGLQRIANAVGKAVVDIITADFVITVKIDPTTYPASVDWK